jgi:hypothetical protein
MVQPNPSLHLTSYSGLHPLPHAGELNHNATGLRTALWRCDLDVELPLVAVSSHSHRVGYGVVVT